MGLTARAHDNSATFVAAASFNPHQSSATATIERLDTRFQSGWNCNRPFFSAPIPRNRCDKVICRGVQAHSQNVEFPESIRSGFVPGLIFAATGLLSFRNIHARLFFPKFRHLLFIALILYLDLHRPELVVQSEIKGNVSGRSVIGPTSRQQRYYYGLSESRLSDDAPQATLRQIGGAGDSLQNNFRWRVPFALEIVDRKFLTKVLKNSPAVVG